MRRVWLSWSSGKDSAAALDALRAAPDVEVLRLLVTFNADADRVAMHAVRRELLLAQAAQLRLPVHAVDLPSPCPNEAYEARMAAALRAAKEDGATDVAFGDLFLDDVRAYREAAMAGTGLGALFPLWHRPTGELAREAVDRGIRAIVTCVDTRQLDRRFAGREFDHAFLDELPAHVDPCGERGEYHTFVYDGPGFARPLDVHTAGTVERDGFVFTDVVGGDVARPAPSERAPRPHR